MIDFIGSLLLFVFFGLCFYIAVWVFNDYKKSKKENDEFRERYLSAIEKIADRKD